MLRQSIGLVILGGVLCGIATGTSAQDMKEHGVLTTVLVQQIKTIVHADSVLGKPVDFEGTKIVPIVSIGFAFGSGGGVSDGREQFGTGGGGGGFVTPQGLLLVTKDGEVKVLEARKGVVSELVKGLAPVMLEAIKGRQSPEKKEEPKGPPPKP